jgi:2-polyprenyl-3-methyl-5-hydroxy-6-metoxy-1,4-benzoquinol methylase
MSEYWESKFKNEGTMWKFEPSDSAILALDLFKSYKFKNILIPGTGYGRNARLFCDNGFKVTGIEISKSAIDLAKMNGINCKIHHGSVTSMPFDKQQYDAVFCYALIHLLNKPERKAFLRSCFNQLKPDGIMVFSVATKETGMYGEGKYLSKNRFEISNGLKVYFYDSESVIKEFADYGLIDCRDIEEPIKFMTGQDPIKLKLVICKKNR